jgi:hypothetical protein
VGSVNKPTTTLKLTLAAFAERRKIGQCFHCNDMYTDDHRDVCMQLFFIEVLVADDNQAPAAGTDDLTISLHMLIGIRPRSGRTMQLAVTVNEVLLTALLDFRSTNNFVDLEAASRAGIILSGQAWLHVVVVNGDHVHCPSSCRNISMIISDELFHLDCYRLTLGSYDMVLGSTGWNHSVLFFGISADTPSPSSGTAMA